MKKLAPTGNLYKLESNKVNKMVRGLTVSNGIGWISDHDKMYLIDSPVRKVYVFDFDLNKGEIYNKQVLIDFWDEQGNPEGMTVDEEGYLWWPLGEEEKWVDGAKKVYEIEISFSYVSSVAFGDKENTIYNFSK